MEETDANVSQMPVVVTVRMTIHSFSKMFATDGKEEAGEQNEKGPAERPVPGAAGKAAALLQDRERVQRGERVRAGQTGHSQIIAKIKSSFTSPQDAPLKSRAGGWQELSSVSEALAMKAGELEFDPQNSQDRGKITGMEPTYNPSAGEEEAGELWGLSACQPSLPHEFQAREIPCLRKVS